MRHPIILAGLLFCLAACGGGGDGAGGIDPRIARLDVYDAQRVRVLGDAGLGMPGMDSTTAANVPTVGAMSVAGYGSLRVETGGTPLVLSGDAQLEIAFGEGTATGDMTNIFGTNPSDVIVDYDGIIDFQSSDVGQGMPLAYAGSLSADGVDLDLDGMMEATLLGNPASAVTAVDLEAIVIQNGTTRDATFIIVLEVTAPPNT